MGGFAAFVRLHYRRDDCKVRMVQSVALAFGSRRQLFQRHVCDNLIGLQALLPNGKQTIEKVY